MNTLLCNFKGTLNNKTLKITDILREAYIIARNNKDNSMLQWIESELNGYSTVKDLPAYRTVNCDIFLLDMHSSYKAIEDGNGKVHILKQCTKSIKEIENFLNNELESELKIECKELEGKLKSAVIVVGKEELEKIIYNVKEILNNWVLELEKKSYY